MVRALITGVSGFAGSHLADLLLSMDGVEVSGMDRPGCGTDNIDHIAGRLVMHECDIKDSGAVGLAVDSVRPDMVFHLAAQTFVPASWADPVETLSTNIIGEVNVLEAVRRLSADIRVLIVGSSEAYGPVSKADLPVKEGHPLNPLSPYAVSKAAQDMLGFQYFRNYGMKIVRTRGFNLSGPRRGAQFVCSGFARQIAMIEAGGQEPVIRVGNLKVGRDFSDVRDMVRGCWLALERGVPGRVYNICSGKMVSIRDILHILIRFSRVEPGGIRVEPDPARMRPGDVPCLVGDNSAFRKATGWEPRIPLEQTLRDLLDYWREKVKVEAAAAPFLKR